MKFGLTYTNLNYIIVEPNLIWYTAGGEKGVEGILYNNVETDKCNESKIIFGNIPNKTVGINNAINTLNSLLVRSCNIAKWGEYTP